MNRQSAIFMALKAAVLLALVPAAPALAQEPEQDAEPDPTFLVETHAFRLILHRSGFKPLSRWADLAEAPRRSLLVLLGNPRDNRNGRLLDRIPGGLKEFLGKGGAVLIATDSHLYDHTALIDLCGHAVTGEKVAGWPARGQRHPKFDATKIYRGQRECLVVDPVDEGGPPLLQNVSRRVLTPLRLTTNIPSYLDEIRAEPQAKVAVLARIPPACWYEGTRLFQGVPGRFLPGAAPPFALSGEYRDGRLLLLADHDVFTNQMMRQRDTGNVEFAFNAVDWLRGGQEQPRDRVLFVEDGVINTELDVRLREVFMPFADFQAELFADGNRILRWIEDEHVEKNHLDKALSEAINEGPARKLFGRDNSSNTYLLLVLLAGVGLALYGLARLRRASHVVDTNTPLFATALTRAAPSASVLLQRHRAALQEDNLGEYAHLLAREWLNNIPGWNRPSCEEAGVLPAVVARGGWWRRRSLCKLFTEVWRLAEAEAPERLTQGEFRRLLAKLEQLRQAVALGELRLE
jgi:hypothetical protein